MAICQNFTSKCLSFTIQIACKSKFANILSLQIFPTYSIRGQHILSVLTAGGFTGFTGCDMSPSKSNSPVSIGGCGCCIAGGSGRPTAGVGPRSIPNKSSNVLSPAGCTVAMDTGTSLDVISSNEGCSGCCHSN